MDASTRYGVLGPLLATSRERLDDLRRRHGPGRLEQLAADAPAPRGFRQALAGPGLAVVAELKRSSPSAGPLRPGLDPCELAVELAGSGAAALSVLTEPVQFGGSLEDLRSVRSVSNVPVLRKDFLVGPEQVLEARAAGADAVLLIVRALEPETLLACLQMARDLGMDALVEVHDEPEMLLAGSVGADLVGINNRDLDRLTVDLRVTEQLARLAPPGATLISESGISSQSDLARLAQCGADAVLVGETLMRAPDPAARLRELLAAGGVAR
jgi:indole-3-glycerol phosphate synthase